MKLTKRQERKINQIKNIFNEKAFRLEQTLEIEVADVNKYFADLRIKTNIKNGNALTETRYQVFVGPRGGIQEATKMTGTYIGDYTKLFRGRMYALST